METCCHPSLASQNWNFLREVCATQDKVRERFKINIANICYLCKNNEETLEHVLWRCCFSIRAWDWIGNIFDLVPNYNIIVSYKSAKGRSRMVKDLWLVANLVVRFELWAMRNKAQFENKQPNFLFFQKRVLLLIQEYSVRLQGYMRNSVEELLILDYFKVRHRQVRDFQPVECSWSPPNENEFLLCCDGAARGNPGVAGAGVVARDFTCGIVGAMSIGLGITTNYLVELYGVIVGLE